MEIKEVQKHAKTFGYTPDFNSIRYNNLKLNRVQKEFKQKTYLKLNDKISFLKKKLDDKINSSMKKQEYLKQSFK